MADQPIHTILFHVHIDSIILWGFVATVVLTSIMNLSQGLGLSRMSLPFMLGTIVTANRDRAQIIGFGCHFLTGWLRTLFYALLFESLQAAAWWLGMTAGLVHGLFVLTTVMPLLPHIHPRMASEHDGPTPTRMLEPPGFMALHYGRRTPLAAMIAHATFGGILGGFYKVVGG